MTQYKEAVAVREQEAAPQSTWRPVPRLFWIMVICAFVGCIVETIFMLVTRGKLMNRSGLLYGQFSLVWGIGAVLFTVSLQWLVKHGRLAVFLGGAVVGTAFEFLCSLIQEKFFGLVFWDYSHLPFSIGGRVNLLFSVFWGLAAMLWMTAFLPRLDRGLDKVPAQWRRGATLVMAVILSLDVILTAGALFRFNARQDGNPADNPVEVFLDQRYPDDRLFHRFTGMRYIGEYIIEHPDFR